MGDESVEVPVESAASEMAALQAEQNVDPALKAVEVPDWANEFDHDTQVLVNKQGWQTPADLAKSYTNLRSMSDDGERLKLPTDADDAEGWAEVFSKLGRPESPEGYELPEIEVAEGEVDMSAMFRQWAHSAGLNQKQTAGLFGDFTSQMNEIKDAQITAQQGAQAAGLTEIKGEWLDNYKDNLTTAMAAAEKMGLDEAGVVAVERQMGTANFLRTYLALGQALAPKKDASGEPASGLMTPEAALAESKRLMGEKEFSKNLLDGRKREVDTFVGLMNIAHKGVYST